MERKSLSQIGELYHRDPSAIKRWMIIYGIPRRLPQSRSGTMFKCQICENEFYVTKGRANRYNPKYCSMACRTKGIRQKWLKETKNLKNTTAITYRLRKQIGKCQICGYCEEPRILTTHHKNMNHKDNSPSNLLLLCPNCHSLEHLKNGNRSRPPLIFFGRTRRPYSEWSIKGEYKCKNCGKVFKSPTLKRKYCFDCLPVNSSKRDYLYMRHKWRTMADIKAEEESEKV